jgi:hypothetical protein
MSEITLESLAKRVEAIERRLAGVSNIIPPLRSWQSVVGISEETEFSRAMQAEMKAIKDAERQEAIQERDTASVDASASR